VTNVSPNGATTSGDDDSGVVSCDTLFSSMFALLLSPRTRDRLADAGAT
jgi:hypothetical protein